MTSFNSVPERRNSINLSKWTWYPKDVLPLWLADMDFPAAPQILAALHRQVAHGVLGYEMPSPAFYETIASRMMGLYGWNVDPESIVYTAGVNNGYNVAARILCSPSRGYLIQTPVYNEFLETGEKLHVSQFVAPLVKKVKGNRISFEVDYDAFRKKVRKAGMFLLCHPHNPVGHIFSRAELKKMAEICIENKVIIVSDEIHSEILLGGARFTPFASLSREIAKYTITLISASKAFNVPGLSCAFAIIPDPTLRKRFFDVTYGMSYEVSTPGLTAAQVAYSGKADTWLRQMLRYLTSNRDFLVDYVTQYMPNIRTTIPDATYLCWLDFSQAGIEGSPFEFFKEKAKVALSDGRLFGKGGEGHLRINFGTSRKLLTEGLERMRKALDSI
ncbi:MAG: putative C-S lyase [Anaerolineales bacterium]|nr:putative C-S lyase [Anaerolineales bacterium]